MTSLDELLGELTLAVAAPSRGHFHRTFSATNWLAESRPRRACPTLGSAHRRRHRPRRTARSCRAAKHQDLMKQQDRLRHQHMRALLERDVAGPRRRLATLRPGNPSPGFSPMSMTATQRVRSVCNAAFRPSVFTPALPIASVNPRSPQSSMRAANSCPALTERLAHEPGAAQCVARSDAT